MNYASGFNLLLIATLAVSTVSCNAGPSSNSKVAPEGAAQVAQPQVPASAPAAAVEPAAADWMNNLAAAQVTQFENGLLLVRLENGMRVAIKESRTAPVVDVRCYVMTGSMYEKEYLGAGLSHLLEHLVAEGAEHDMGAGATAKDAQRKVNRIVKIGGQSNAYTTSDHTCYYISAAAGKTMECVDLVADWMANPRFTKEDFQREHGVVQRELEMGKDNPERQFYAAQQANIFPGHPAGVPTIGYKAPLAALTYEDVRTYHARTYVPQNMVFVVTGDVDAKAVLERIQKNLAGFQAGRTPVNEIPEVQPLASTRRMVVPHSEVQETIQSIAFQSITLFDQDLYALDLLAAVLGDGQSSRLVNNVHRRDKLVTSIGTSSWTPHWGRGIFVINFRTQPDQADKAQEAVLAELRELAEKGVTQQELARAKRQKVAEMVYSQQTASSQGAIIGSDLMSTGSPGFTGLYVQRIQDVTAGQVQAAARKYFQFDRVAITRLVPAGKSTATAAATGPAAVQSAKSFTLANGLRVVLRPVASPTGQKGLVSMVLAVKGGLMRETVQTAGVGSIMASLSTKGAGKRSAEDIAAFFDDAGGSIAGACGNNSIYWQATVLSDSFKPALDIFSDVVQRPTFSAKELEILRPGVLAEINRIDANWSSQLSKYWRSVYFAGTPYAQLPTGTESTVKAVTSEQLINYHAQAIKAGSSVLTVAGDFDADQARNAVEVMFSGMPAGEITLSQYPARKVAGTEEFHILPTKNEVAAINISAPSITIFDRQDKFALDVLDTIISGWQLPSGWMHSDLRGRQLVYVVHSYNWPGIIPGAFVTYAACQPDKANEVIDIIRGNLDKAAKYTPTQEEVDQAVNTILTAELLNDQSISGLAMGSALDELWGFGYEFRNKLESVYRQVKPEDVRRVGEKYLGKGYVITVTTPTPQAIKTAATQPAK